MANDEIVDSISASIEKLLEEKTYSEIEEFSLLYSSAPVLISFFIAKVKNLEKNYATLRYVDLEGQTHYQFIPFKHDYVYEFIDRFLHLQLSKSARGREDVVSVLKAVVRNFAVVGSQAEYQELTEGIHERVED